MTDELWHHGILGQKWGDRNGPPYPLDNSQKSPVERKKSYSVKYRKPSTMTTSELQDAISRMKTEQEYLRLYSQLNPKKRSILDKLASGAQRHGSTLFDEAVVRPFAKGIGSRITRIVAGESKEDTDKKKKETEKDRIAREEHKAKMEAMDALAKALGRLGNERIDDVRDTRTTDLGRGAVGIKDQR